VNVTARDRETGAKRNIIIKQTKERLAEDEKDVARETVQTLAGTLSTPEPREEAAAAPFTAEEEAPSMPGGGEKTPAQVEAEFYISDAKAFVEEKGQDITDELRAQIKDCINLLEEAVEHNFQEKIDMYSDRLLMLLSDADITG
jgi:molecular chaperone DnaK (HSP70)